MGALYVYSYLHITRERELTYILVAQVEDKLAVSDLALNACSLGESDVELQGGVGSQVSQITGVPHLHCRFPVKLHRHTDLTITVRKMTGENRQGLQKVVRKLRNCAAVLNGACSTLLAAFRASAMSSRILRMFSEMLDTCME